LWQIHAGLFLQGRAARINLSQSLPSAATFSVGATAPLALVLVSPSNWLIPVVSVGSLAFLALLGIVGARTGGAEVLKPTIHVTFWGTLAMAATAAIGAILGTVI
jgi:VIT1/CCC1 family predicted Fe2+/Mn2+ transporter